MNLITLQHVRINGESCVSVEDGRTVAMIFDLADARNEGLADLTRRFGNPPHLLLTAFLRTL